MENNKIRVAITQGDTNGIGYELIFKTFSEPEMLEICTPVVYGSPKVAAYHSKALGAECPFTIINNANDAHAGKLNLLTCSDEDIKVEIGQGTAESRMAAVKALDRALTDARNGLFDVLVCNPAHTLSFSMGEYKFPGFEEFIEISLNEGQKCLPVYVSRGTRIVIACNDVKGVTSKLTAECIQEKARALHTSLRRDFFLSNPRIAILALNPADGKEETEILKPAIEALATEKINVFGPYKADVFFAERQYESFDGIIAMHPDQGLIPIRMLSNGDGVKLLTAMPVACVAPDIDEQFGIAGKNIADENILRNAIYLGIDVCRHRAEYDLPLQNPLQKLYHERPDSGEKLRFSIPKKKENNIP